ncbi:MAG TPA: zf-HC2 domain-containing protein [Candidatus Methylomirabilis sp.]|nr:zf-HC2 domain-containing protein [Candidatus Methylomirabilis sp.]
MTWTCEQTEARLSDYLDGLIPPAEAHEFNLHVNSCAVCSQLVAGVSHVVGGLHSLEPVQPPPQLVRAILNQTLGPRTSQQGWRSSFGWLRALGTLRFAYSAISLAATLLILLSASGFSWRRPKLANLAPANIYRNADRGVHLVYARSTKFVSDLRVVYEIQSRLSKESDLPVAPESTVPQSAPGKSPGSSDSTKPGPRQQNRANGIGHGLEILAAEAPAFSTQLCGHLLPRRLP